MSTPKIPFHIKSDVDIVRADGTFVCTTLQPNSEVGCEDDYNRATQILRCINALQDLLPLATSQAIYLGVVGENGEYPQELLEAKEALAALQQTAPAPQVQSEDTFTGFLAVHGERFQVDFVAPTGAPQQTTDAAFLAALAQTANIQIDYLALGSS